MEILEFGIGARSFMQKALSLGPIQVISSNLPSVGHDREHRSTDS